MTRSQRLGVDRSSSLITLGLGCPASDPIGVDLLVPLPLGEDILDILGHFPSDSRRCWDILAERGYSSAATVRHDAGH